MPGGAMAEQDAGRMRGACSADAKGNANTMHAPMRPRCNGTGRYGTERKSHQDPDEIPSVLDAAGAVDKGESLSRKALSDEWFDDFIARVSAKAAHWQHRVKLRQEQDAITPPAVVAARDYQDETEQLARYLRGQQSPPQIAAPTERIA